MKMQYKINFRMKYIITKLYEKRMHGTFSIFFFFLLVNVILFALVCTTWRNYLFHIHLLGYQLPQLVEDNVLKPFSS